MRTTTRLRELLAGPDLIVAPGAYDALSARLIAQAGFSVVYMTGFGMAASVLGQPDVGLLTMSEMVSRASALAAVIGDVPLIADADTGYGNPINVRRTIHEYERAGAADMHIKTMYSISIGMCDDHKVRVLPGFIGGADFLDHFMHRDDLLSLHLPVLIARNMVFDMQGGTAC